MGLRVIQAGAFTTVQDLGRRGYRAWGIPWGGSFDAESAALANALVGNPVEAAVLEFTGWGGVYEAETPLALAAAGAPMRVRVEGAEGAAVFPLPVSFTLAEGRRLLIGGAPWGCRCYLAVAGGWQTASTLGSRSQEVPLRAGDHLPASAGRASVRRTQSLGLPSRAPRLVRFVDGADWQGCASLDGLSYTVGRECNRMGLRLDGPFLDVTIDPERDSTPVAPGAVQVAGGRPIVLGVAAGTLGGYPHVAQVLTADLPVLAQARTGDPLRFHRVEVIEARRIDRTFREESRRRFLRVATAVRDGPGLADAARP